MARRKGITEEEINSRILTYLESVPDKAIITEEHAEKSTGLERRAIRKRLEDIDVHQNDYPSIKRIHEKPILYQRIHLESATTRELRRLLRRVEELNEKIDALGKELL